MKDDNGITKEKNAIIIGWGLAGAILAWQLFFCKKKFTVYDSGENHSTRAAAGIVNPIVFKRLTKSWKADLLLPNAIEFYKKVEEITKHKLLYQKNIFRVFASVEEENQWSVKQGDNRFSDYLNNTEFKNLSDFEKVTHPFGLGEVNTIGHLDTIKFLEISKTYFEQSKNSTFVSNRFEYNSIQNKEIQNYFFCEGTGIKSNPYFNSLPLRPTHGEVLIIKAKNFKIEHILNKNMFIMPLGDNKYKVGATYNWELKTPETTVNARKELIEKLESFTDFEYEIIDQIAGIRPTVKDRRPLIGSHPEISNLHVFNGLGTKGVMLGPYFANQLIQTVFYDGEIDKEVDVKRFLV